MFSTRTSRVTCHATVSVSLLGRHLIEGALSLVFGGDKNDKHFSARDKDRAHNKLEVTGDEVFAFTPATFIHQEC